MFAIEAVTALISAVVDCKSARRRGGRVAEGGGLLNRYTVKSCIGGSNPPLSASPLVDGHLAVPTAQNP